jgi:hypothetical protein
MQTGVSKMKRKEFMESLCGLLAEFDMEGQPMLSAFPCICGGNTISNDGDEVCEITAKKIFAVIKNLIPCPIHVEMHADGSTTTCNEEFDSEEWAPAPVKS